jgi:predicted ATPase/DNA-binding CsgD family transcriptional regulator
MAPPDAGESGTASEQPQNPRRLRAVEPAEAEPAPRTPERPPDNLPSELSSFVGREKELAEVKRLLEHNRLLTLTGSGGCGKTRLALVAAREVVEGFEDGVWLVELAPLADPALVPQVVASTLGVREQPGRSPTETLSDYLGSKKVLLVVDNCEHLVETCAELAETLLHSCPELRVLATSREALGITGEVAWPVPSLSLPDLRRLPDVEGLPRYESARLFVERTVAVKPTFELTEENAVAVAKVCYRLDGIPLAIELAAARAKVLSAEQIASRLDDSFRLLKTQVRTTDPRQRTLRATVEWSHELLSEQERILFRRLSVFAGGWTLEAAEEVCAGVGVEEDEVLDVLSRLVDKSLVSVAERGGETRYRLLETVRRYGQERLEESGEAGPVGERHANHYLALADEAEPELRGAQQVLWLQRLSFEHDNLRAAMAWLLGEGESERAAGLGWDLWLFWWSRGFFSEGRRWMDEALAQGGAMGAPARARALFVAGTMAIGQADFPSAEPLLEETIGLFRGSGDKRGAAHALGAIGVVAIGQEQNERAIALHEEAAELFLEVGDKWAAGNELGFAAVGWFKSGDYVRARQLAERGLDLAQEIGGRSGTYAALILAAAAQALGDHERAGALFRECLKFMAEVEDQANVDFCLGGLAAVAGSAGRIVRAARLWGAEEALLERIEVGVHAYVLDRTLRKSQIDAARARLGEEAFAAAWAEGRTMSPERAIEYALEREPTPDPAASEPYPSGLSAREAEVLRLVATGLTNAEVAQKLFLSSRTVNWHLTSIYRKLGSHSRTEATRFAAEHDLL